MNRADDLFSKLTAEGETAINELIVTRKAEELFLDFKRSGDDGAGQRLHESDCKNFSKAISGFGNSEGGVVIWGVDCTMWRLRKFHFTMPLHLRADWKAPLAVRRSPHIQAYAVFRSRFLIQ